MKRYFISGLIALILILGFSLVKTPDPTKTERQPNQSARSSLPNTSGLPSGVQKIQVFHFHATQQCISCINVGKFTKEVIEEKFAREFKSGKIVFKEVNVDLPENLQIVQKYQVSGSALFISVVKDGQEYQEEDTTVWRLVVNEGQLKNYFETKLKAIL